MRLEAHLRDRRAAGRSLLVPYVTGGLGAAWLDVVRAVVDAGADAVEIGIPFSDPVMDGRTIQEASQRALDIGATPAKVVAEAAQLDVTVPLVVMTYYNPVLHAGHARFAGSLADAGIDGAIVPDLPLDELDGWGDAADTACGGLISGSLTRRLATRSAVTGGSTVPSATGTTSCAARTWAA